jgi:hypothetical protein
MQMHVRMYAHYPSTYITVENLASVLKFGNKMSNPSILESADLRGGMYSKVHSYIRILKTIFRTNLC